MKNLAPMIFRQRLIVEGIPRKTIDSKEIKKYLSALGKILNMKVLIEPITHKSSKFGWSGWVHWETSGSHFYAWDTPITFFSVDIYTCKKFDPQKAISFTKRFFRTKQLSYKNV